MAPIVLAADGGAAAAAAPVIVRGFVAGGRDQPLQLAGRTPGPAAKDLAYEPARIPLIAQPLTFHIAPNPQVAAEPIRVRYRLEGWDDDWQDLEGIMFLALRFLDANGRRISSVSLPRKGSSAGWIGDPRTSPFRTMAESVVVPPRARRLQIYLVSGGDRRTTGIWLVKGLRLFVAADSGDPARLLLDEHLQEGIDLGQPEGALPNWRREGTNSHTPQIYTLPAPAETHTLALIDTDVLNSGSWAAWDRNIVDVEPGQTLRIEADEAFSIGRGGDHACSYHKLAAGRYVFRVIPTDEYGRQNGVGMQLPLVVVPPVSCQRVVLDGDHRRRRRDAGRRRALHHVEAAATSARTLRASSRGRSGAHADRAGHPRRHGGQPDPHFPDQHPGAAPHAGRQPAAGRTEAPGPCGPRAGDRLG
jgi:hypothetical protein